MSVTSPEPVVKLDRPRRRTARESAGRNTHAVVLSALKSRLAAGKVFEIPCGTGAFLDRLRDAPYQAIGSDLDLSVLDAGHCALAANMSDSLPLATASMDALVSIEGIEHIQRPFDFIRECRRVLKQDGWLFLTTPNISSARSRWRWFMTGFHNKAKSPLDESRPALRHHISMRSFPELRYMLHTQGFEVEALATNRIKAASALYTPWWVVQWLAGRVAFRQHAKNPDHQRIIEEVHRQMLEPAVFFGESLILVARAR